MSYSSNTRVVQSSCRDHFIVGDSYYSDCPINNRGYCDDCDCEKVW